MAATNAQLRELIQGRMNPPIDNIGDALRTIVAFGTPVPYGTEIKIQFCVYDIVPFKAAKSGTYVWLVGDNPDKAVLRENMQLLAMVNDLRRNVDLIRVTVFNGGKMQLIKSWKVGDLVCITVRPTVWRKVYCQGVLESVIR
ncbi:hypothetical protein As57867_005411, partial [Aphanomyces stellatus]